MAGVFDQITGQANTENNHERNDVDQVYVVDPGKNETLAVPAVADIDEGSEARTNIRLREASQELLKYGLLDTSQKPNLYRAAVVNMNELNAIFEPLDLFAYVDEIRGLVFLKVRKNDSEEEQDEWGHPLVRRQRLNLEQSLLVAILRQYFIAYEQEAGSGASQAIITLDELIPQLQGYLGDTGSEAKERNRMLQLLDQLKGYGLVSAPDINERVTIRPIIAHLANPENLQALLCWLNEQSPSVNYPDEQEEAG